MSHPDSLVVPVQPMMPPLSACLSEPVCQLPYDRHREACWQMYHKLMLYSTQLLIILNSLSPYLWANNPILHRFEDGEIGVFGTEAQSSQAGLSQTDHAQFGTDGGDHSRNLQTFLLDNLNHSQKSMDKVMAPSEGDSLGLSWLGSEGTMKNYGHQYMGLGRLIQGLRFKGLGVQNWHLPLPTTGNSCWQAMP